MNTAYVALGANLADPVAQIGAALEALAGLPQSQLLRASSLYRTAPLEVPEPQPDYINAVARLATTLTPHALLDELLALEARFGRVRPYRWAPRALDLDLLLYGDVVLDTPRLTLPHPRLHRRAFVLEPLLELDSFLEAPGLGPLSAWRARLSDQDVERLLPHPA